MAFYECVLIARQDITSAQVETLVGQFSEILEQNGGTVASEGSTCPSRGARRPAHRAP